MTKTTSKFGYYEDMIDRGRQLHEAGDTNFSLRDRPPRQADWLCSRTFVNQDRDVWIASVMDLFDELPEGFFNVEFIG